MNIQSQDCLQLLGDRVTVIPLSWLDKHRAYPVILPCDNEGPTSVPFLNFIKSYG